MNWEREGSVTSKRVLLLVDFKYRDLPGLALLKVLLEQMGSYDVVLAPHVSSFDESFYLRKYRPHLVALPYLLTPDHVARARRMRKQGVGVAVIPTEGFSILPEDWMCIAGGFLDLECVDLFFVWNESIAELVSQHRRLPFERCVVAGVPRLDFYRPPLRDLFLSKERFCARYDMDPLRPVVTWATNFAFVLFAGKPAEITNLVERYRAAGFTRYPVYSDLPALIEREVESREVLTRAVLRVAERYPDAYVVIKVHPGEELAWYYERAAAAGLANVRIVGREYIWDVLSATDVHLHRACTTGLEAWLLDKPTIDLQFAPGDWLRRAEIAQGEDLAASVEECVDRIGYYLAGGEIPGDQRAARRRIIRWFFGPVDGQSAQRHAEAIHNWLEKSAEEPRLDGWSHTDLSRTMITGVKRLIGLQPHHSLRAWLRRAPQDPRGKYFGPDDEQQWLEDIRGVLNGQVPRP